MFHPADNWGITFRATYDKGEAVLLRLLTILAIALMSLSVLAGCKTTVNQDKKDTKQEEEKLEDENGDKTEDKQSEEEPRGETVNISIRDFAFDPSEIRAKAGQKVTLRITNNGSLSHNYTITELDEKANVGSGSTEDLEITFPEPGRYQFLCTLPGHADKGMTGQIIVE